jgi:cytosine/uracil/thiamine/allantoin permease
MLTYASDIYEMCLYIMYLLVSLLFFFRKKKKKKKLETYRGLFHLFQHLRFSIFAGLWWER